MALYPDYTNLATLKAHLRVGDTNDDTAMTLAITAASRAIDYECNRQFGSAYGSRVFTYDPCMVLDGRPALPIFDLASADELVVATDQDDSGSWSTPFINGTEYLLWPYNALADGRPWTHLLMTNRSNYSLPWTQTGIQITGTFGWVSVPAVVTQACLIQAARFFVRRDSAYGVAGSPEQGNELRLLAKLDPDVALLLTGVVRRWGAV